MSISVVEILHRNQQIPLIWLITFTEGLEVGIYLHALTHFYLDTRCRKLAISPNTETG